MRPPKALPSGPPPSTALEETIEWLADVARDGAKRVELRAPLGDAPLRVVRFGDSDVSDNEIKVRAERIHRLAVGDARSHGRRLVVYALNAYDKSGEILGSFRLQIGGEARSDDLDAQTLEASGGVERVLTVVVKHNENLTRLTMARLEQLETGALEHAALIREDLLRERARTVELSAQLDTSVTMRLETYKRLEEMHSMHLERQLAIEAADKKGKREDRVMGMIETYGPLVFNRVAGGGPGKGGPLGKDMMQKLWASFSTTQLKAMVAAGDLSTEQLAIFLELAESYGEEYEQKQQGEARRLEAAKARNGQPEDAAAAPREPAS